MGRVVPQPEAIELSGAARKTVRYGKPRRDDWHARLNWWYAEARTQKMRHGVTDCALTCADAVLAQTGFDPASGLRGKYFTERGAGKMIARHGGLEALATKLLGPPLPSPLLAMTGDIGLFKSVVEVRDTLAEAETLGVVMGAAVHARAFDGMTTRPRSVLLVAWPVGYDA